MDEALLAPQAIDLPLTWRYSRFVSGRLSTRINCRLPAATPEEGAEARRNGTPNYSTRRDMQLITPFPRSVALADPRSAASARVDY